MRRWLSRQANTGVATATFTLPSSPLPGLWKIEVDAEGQKESKVFLVEKHYERRFEVYPRMEPFIPASSETISGTVSVAFTHDLPVKGVLRIALKCKPRPDPPCSPKSSDYTTVNTTDYIQFYNSVDFEFPMTSLTPCLEMRAGAFEGIEVEVEVLAEEYFTRMTSSGFCRARIVDPKLRLRFLTANGAVFKPGMPFETQIWLSYDDKQPVEPEKLENWPVALTVQPKPEVVTHHSGM
jgi:hypothetical protein